MITVGIKALNEEKHIAASIASAIEAVRGFQGEVIVADSGSTDGTIKIAKQFAVRVFQLANPAERSCGAGAQLAFQHARGDYFYLLDGDMVLDPGFLPAAVAYLEANPEIAAVGGEVREMNIENQEFQIRAKSLDKDPNRIAGIVDRLEGGGLYRTSALREVGYFADRNLHAFEEFELAARLQSRGWKMARIDATSVEHFGHTLGGFRLLGRRIRSGYLAATGEILRSAIGTPQLLMVLKRLSHIRNGLIVVFWWAALLYSITFNLTFFLILIFAPLAFLTIRRGSLPLGIYSFASWNACALGLLQGLLHHRIPPDQKIDSIEITSQQHTLKMTE